MKSLNPVARTAVRFLLTLLMGSILGGCFLLIEILRRPDLPASMVQRLFILCAFYCVSMTVLSLTLFSIIGRLNRRKGWSAVMILQAIGALLIAGLLANWIGGHLMLIVYPDFNILNWRQYVSFSLNTIVFGLPAFLYVLFHELWKKALQKVREKELAEERLEKELLSARLQALQAQTNPHFLYNALNSIAALIATDPAGAEAAVERLAGLFRYAMESHDGRSAALAQEVGVIEDYLAIEKVRFGERLQLQIVVDPALLQSRVPSLLMQPLVENAIKHGVSQREDPTEVEIKAEAADGNLRFTVRNQGPPLAPEKSWRGIGIRNMRSRCETLFGVGYSFRLYEPGPGWVEAELVIPRSAAENKEKRVESSGAVPA